MDACLNSLQELPTQLGRKLLVAEFRISGQSFAVATSHLEVRFRFRRVCVRRHVMQSVVSLEKSRDTTFL